MNPSRFHKIEGVEKIYDAIYVANPKKRVDRFLRAVVSVSRRRPGYRAAIICVRAEKSPHSEALNDTIIWGKNRSNIDFLKGVKQPRLNELFNQSKVNVLLSLREGMNKGLAEGLFSGTPALLLAESACGNHRHINESTGRIVCDRRLEDMLEWFSVNHESFRPDQWVNENASPRASTIKLEEALKSIELASGREWTMGLAIKANQPGMEYIEPHLSPLLDAREEIVRRFLSD